MALFDEHRPDVVLMDIKLDDDDGIELSRQLLAKRRCAVVVISAFSDAELIGRAGAAGVFGYLIKPVSRESLAAQIERGGLPLLRDGHPAARRRGRAVRSGAC